MMKRLKKNDEVIIIAGKDKGKQGKITRVLLNDRVIVEGMNLVKKHSKPNPSKGVSGGIVNKEMPIHASNVMLYDTHSKQGSRIGFKQLDNGDKVRYFKKSQETLI